ncbi:hypothetical protein AVEN_255964-1 [Araneus ventricosus]|uniref:Uncharacterized protein n=1 Tax=Araneus ventricosus TaxID=182803 RepID=A0A4Y2R3T5_ARAVE|nr:hypothetical protein AVEN_255964-1 [Araneus ventricosus]
MLKRCRNFERDCQLRCRPRHASAAQRYEVYPKSLAHLHILLLAPSSTLTNLTRASNYRMFGINICKEVKADIERAYVSQVRYLLYLPIWIEIAMVQTN